MKILVVNYEYPPVGGGGGRVAAQLASELARRGHHVRVQTSRVAGLPSHEVSSEGVDVHRRFAFRRKPDTCSVPEMGGYVLANALPVWDAARTWKPDVMHVHFAVPTGPVAWLASRLTGVPYVLTVHLGDVPGGAPEQTDHLFRLVKPFTRPVWRDAAAVTAVSSHVAALAGQAYGVSPRVILNGTPVRETEPPAPDGGGILRLLFTGRISVQKNPVFLGRVLASMRGRPWKAVFLGDGPLRGALEDELRRGGVWDKCEFRGWVDEGIVRAVMKESDLLVMPSLSEGLPVAAIEAVAHGLAICGSAIPGLRDVLADGANGWVLPLDDEEAWRSALEEAMNDREELRRRQTESLGIARKFDFGKIVSAYEETLASVVRK
ncbi:MAG: glycosyltransferase family 4 protein [Chthoniobacterales bacterium]|nr:glycosyltransferase family 4 protein [Chthoniobacterales bacterium]